MVSLSKHIAGTIVLLAKHTAGTVVLKFVGWQNAHGGNNGPVGRTRSGSNGFVGRIYSENKGFVGETHIADIFVGWRMLLRAHLFAELKTTSACSDLSSKRFGAPSRLLRLGAFLEQLRCVGFCAQARLFGFPEQLCCAVLCASSALWCG